MEENLNKKWLLFIIKHSTWIIGFFYFIQIVFGCFGFQSIILTYLFSASIVPVIVLLSFSRFLKFCIWHRLPLYYMLTADTINAIDFYIGIPVSAKWMLVIYLLLIGIFILVGCLIKNKTHAKERNSKKNST